MRWLIDASKDPYRLFWLEASGHFDIRVIHLVRRPEGFVDNMMRSAGAHGMGAAVKYAGRWLIDNLIGVTLLRRLFPQDAVKRVRYEDLATDPERTLGDICAWLDVDFNPERAHATRFMINHGVSGNRPRWEALPVTFNENWRVTLSPLQRRLISLVTIPLAGLWSQRRTSSRHQHDSRTRRRSQPQWMTRSSG